MSTSAQNGVVLALAVAAWWYLYPAPGLMPVMQALQLAGQAFRREEWNSGQVLLSVILKSQHLNRFDRRNP